MKINLNTKIVGDRIILVPYRRHHVEKYHEWMSLTEIQELTASEPLSMEEEYEMQEKWQQDDDKLTFIVLRKDLYESTEGNREQREINAMIGDVNCFLIDEDNEDSNDQQKQGELEVMIVDKANRGSGYGSEAVFLMLNYCYRNLTNLNRFLVKIGEENTSSRRMFEKLGFVQYKYIEPFKQVCLKFELDVFEKSTSIGRFKFSKDFPLDIQSYN